MHTCLCNVSVTFNMRLTRVALLHMLRFRRVGLVLHARFGWVGGTFIDMMIHRNLVIYILHARLTCTDLHGWYVHAWSCSLWVIETMEIPQADIYCIHSFTDDCLVSTMESLIWSMDRLLTSHGYIYDTKHNTPNIHITLGVNWHGTYMHACSLSKHGACSMGRWLVSMYMNSMYMNFDHVYEFEHVYCLHHMDIQLCYTKVEHSMHGGIGHHHAHNKIHTHACNTHLSEMRC